MVLILWRAIVRFSLWLHNARNDETPGGTNLRGLQKLTVHCGEADLMQKVIGTPVASDAGSIRPTETGFKP